MLDDESPTSANLGNDHVFIIKEYSLHAGGNDHVFIIKEYSLHAG